MPWWRADRQTREERHENNGLGVASVINPACSEIVARLDVEHGFGTGQGHIEAQPGQVTGTQPLHGSKCPWGTWPARPPRQPLPPIEHLVASNHAQRAANPPDAAWTDVEVMSARLPGPGMARNNQWRRQGAVSSQCQTWKTSIKCENNADPQVRPQTNHEPFWQVWRSCQCMAADPLQAGFADLLATTGTTQQL